MQDLQARLTRLCSDIAHIERELKQAARQDEAARSTAIPDEQLLIDLKSAVDRLRHLLWPYMQAAAQRANGLDEILQRYRMERVTTMLHDLTDRVTEPRLAALPEAQSFFSNIQEIATTAVEKHLERVIRKPISRALPPLDPKTSVN